MFLIKFFFGDSILKMGNITTGYLFCFVFVFFLFFLEGFFNLSFFSTRERERERERRRKKKKENERKRKRGESSGSNLEALVQRSRVTPTQVPYVH